MYCHRTQEYLCVEKYQWKRQFPSCIDYSNTNIHSQNWTVALFWKCVIWGMSSLSIEFRFVCEVFVSRTAWSSWANPNSARVRWVFWGAFSKVFWVIFIWLMFVRLVSWGHSVSYPWTEFIVLRHGFSPLSLSSQWYLVTNVFPFLWVEFAFSF